MNRNKGFTLAELLIVVAIIAVLVAIAIPIFTTQLEKSRETVDIANARAAYVELMEQVISGKTDATVTFDLKQTQDDWQSIKEIKIGNVKHSVSEGDTANWKGYPGAGGQCVVSYDETIVDVKLDKDEIIDGVIFTWSGGTASAKGSGGSASTSYNIDNFGGIVNGAWNSSGEAKNNTYVSRRSTNSLVELDPNSTYTLTYTVPAEYVDQGVEIGTLLFTDSNGTTSVKGQRINNTTQQASSGWISGTVNNGTAAQNYQTVTTNSDGSRTITQTINTDADNVYFGANFCVESGVNLSKNPTALAAVEAAMNSLTLTKN